MVMENQFIINKLNLTKLLIVCFILNYLLCQTYLIDENRSFLIFSQAVLLIALFATVFDRLINTCKSKSLIIFFCLFSILFENYFFEFEHSLIQIAYKVFLCSLFITLFEKHGQALLILMANTYLVVTVLALIISWIFIMDQTCALNHCKSLSVFLNANIPSLFLFYTLNIYFILRLKKLFYFCALLMMFAYFLGYYSRTALLGSTLLIVYELLSFDNVYTQNLIMLFKKIFIVTFFACVFCFILIKFNMSWLYSTEGNQIFYKIDLLLSNRLLIVIFAFNAAHNHGLLHISPFDSIIYEMFIFGPLFIYYTIKNLMFNKRVSNETVCFMDRCTFAFIVLLIIGFFEGLIMKFSPSSLFFVLYIFSPSLFIENCFLKDMNSNLIKQSTNISLIKNYKIFHRIKTILIFK